MTRTARDELREIIGGRSTGRSDRPPHMAQRSESGISEAVCGEQAATCAGGSGRGPDFGISEWRSWRTQMSQCSRPSPGE